jgi:hypothetical protein
VTASYLVTGRVEAVPSLGQTHLSLDVQPQTVGVHAAGVDPGDPRSLGAGLAVEGSAPVSPPARAEEGDEFTETFHYKKPNTRRVRCSHRWVPTVNDYFEACIKCGEDRPVAEAYGFYPERTEARR